MALLVMTLFLALALTEFQDAGAHTSGGLSLEDSDVAGCHCHNVAPNPEVTLNLMGVPQRYDPTMDYDLVITVAGGPAIDEGMLYSGGFMLSCTNGSFAVPEGSDTVQVFNDDRSASHTAAGATQRQWRLVWQAPNQGTGDAMFLLSVNSVNGDGVETGELDQYNQLRTVSSGAPQEVVGDDGVSEWGIPLAAYWMGTIAFIATFVLVWAAFYLIRGTSRHHVVHVGSRQRYLVEERTPPSSFGAALMVGVLTVVEVAAAVVLFRGIVEGAGERALAVNLAVVLALFVAIVGIYRSAFVPRVTSIEPEGARSGKGV